jgi:hypothetical protein
VKKQIDNCNSAAEENDKSFSRKIKKSRYYYKSTEFQVSQKSLLEKSVFTVGRHEACILLIRPAVYCKLSPQLIIFRLLNFPFINCLCLFLAGFCSWTIQENSTIWARPVKIRKYDIFFWEKTKLVIWIPTCQVKKAVSIHNHFEGNGKDKDDIQSVSESRIQPELDGQHQVQIIVTRALSCSPPATLRPELLDVRPFFTRVYIRTTRVYHLLCCCCCCCSCWDISQNTAVYTKLVSFHHAFSILPGPHAGTLSSKRNYPPPPWMKVLPGTRPRKFA